MDTILDIYKFEPIETKKPLLHDTDSESSEEEEEDDPSTATVSMPTAIEQQPGNDTVESIEDETEDDVVEAVVAVTIAAESPNVACIYCAVKYKKGGVKRHQRYCSKRPE